MARLLMLVFLASLLLGACQPGATPTPTAAPKTQAQPAAGSPAASPATGSPVTKAAASPSPSPAAAATPSSGILGTRLTTDGLLSIIGVVLTIVVVVAWILSNRAEATPNPDQLEEMRHFVREQFAAYVAGGLPAEATDPPSIAQDPAWRKIYIQHLRLHNELYAFRRDVALRVFEQEIDPAVRRQLDALRSAGARPGAAVIGDE